MNRRIQGPKELLCIKDLYMVTGELAFEKGLNYHVNANGSTRSRVSYFHYVTEDLLEDKSFVEINENELK